MGMDASYSVMYAIRDWAIAYISQRNQMIYAKNATELKSGNIYLFILKYHETFHVVNTEI